MSGYDPLQLPAPIGYGYMGELRAPIDAGHAFQMGQPPRMPGPTSPEDMQYRIQNYRDQLRIPDAVKASMGAGDKEVVGELLKIVNGEEARLQVGPTLAGQLLDSWGYPRDPNAWTYDEWQQALSGHMLDPDPQQSVVQSIGY